jgi:hypothetical protein
MRIISAAIAAIFFAVSSAGAFAASPASIQGVKSEPAFELVKAKKAKAKAKKGKKAKATKGKKAGGKGAGKCGAGKYWKKGACLSAADKK